MQQEVKLVGVFSLLVLFGIHACYSMEQIQEKTAKPALTAYENPVPSLAGSYLAARHASLYADNEKASYYLTQALNYDPQDMELTTQAIRSYLLAGDIESAVRVAHDRKPEDSVAPLSHLVMFIEAARTQEWEAADQHLENIKTYGLQAVTLPFLRSWVHLAQIGEVTPPETTLTLKHSFYQSFINYQNALLHDVAGDAKQAAVFYDLALNDMDILPPRFVTGAMHFYIRQDNEARAREIYRNFQDANASNLFIQVQPASAVIEQLRREGKEPLVADAKGGIAEVMYTMSNLLHGEMVDREALVYVRMALMLRPDFPEATMLLGDILEESGKSKQALAAYQTIPKESVLYRRAAIRQAFLLDEQKKSEKAIMLLQGMARTQPNPSDIYMTLGDILRNKERYDDAAAAYSKALASVEKIQPYHWPLFYTRGISYERAGDWKKAEADLLHALSLEPNQPDVQNYLAYSWLLQGQHVEKATKMLEDAAMERPDDGHIIDSLAWAYYMTGKYDLALQYMEQAIELMPHDPTVNDHYGDVLWQIGRRNEARYQWERALYYKPETLDAQKIKLKLEAGLPSNPALQQAINHTSVVSR